MPLRITHRTPVMQWRSAFHGPGVDLDMMVSFGNEAGPEEIIPRSFACLNDASLFEADKVAFLADDDMIQKVNAQDLASLMQPLRHAFIFRAGFWIAGRVIVSHQDRGGITQDRRLKDLSKVANNVLQLD